MTSKEAMSVVDALADIYKAPSELLEHVLQRIYSFVMMHPPKEISTEDDPPVKLDKRAEIIRIDGFLGLYSPDRQEITIFKKGIQVASDMLRVNPEHLKIIVRIHEWAHSIFHLGVTEKDRLKILKDDSYWSAVLNTSTQLFKEIENSLHELLAQILTFHCIQDLKQNAKTAQGKQTLEKVEETFHRLSSHQPPEYRIDDLLDVPRDRILKSIGLLKNRSLAGKAETWKTVVTW
jgi:hypothetical protein